MKIRQRRNGGFCLEHNGVEAPYVVVRAEAGLNAKWSVFDIDDEDMERPIIENASQQAAESAAIKHFNGA